MEWWTEFRSSSCHAHAILNKHMAPKLSGGLAVFRSTWNRSNDSGERGIAQDPNYKYESCGCEIASSEVHSVQPCKWWCRCSAGLSRARRARPRLLIAMTWSKSSRCSRSSRGEYSPSQVDFPRSFFVGLGRYLGGAVRPFWVMDCPGCVCWTTLSKKIQKSAGWTSDKEINSLCSIECWPHSACSSVKPYAERSFYPLKGENVTPSVLFLFDILVSVLRNSAKFERQHVCFANMFVRNIGIS